MSVRTVVGALPSGPGIYRFRDAGGRVLYIGRAADLRRRVASYWGRLRDRPHLRRMVPQIDRVEAVACDSDHEAAWLERNVLEHSKPRWNRTRGGQEVPVYIGLTAGGFRVVHEHEARFDDCGPHLGGTKVRLAVAALHRAIPLAYTGAGLAGFDRDLARMRGVSPGSAAALLDLASAVLSRDPAALATVREALELRRDAASTALAFELAARIQAEVEALDWVLAEQKVTGRDRGEAEVHGWSDGLLVSFTIRAGRVRTWTQRGCGEAVASARVAATPPAWQPFAARNAALAATLLVAAGPNSRE